MATSSLKDTLNSKLKYELGKDAEHATLYDWRVALSLSAREHMVDTWFASTKAT
ncbi:MAG: hypothetical protein HRU32_10035, partial [Rhodobacteraceae bacterium]|nr:hypothetical protein [Paracoccaceae bacterium]